MFADDEWSSSVDPEALSKIKSAQDWTDIDKPFKVLTSNVLFSLMAHWDIEFCQRYFYAFEPRPLFSLLLPKLDSAAKYLDESTIAKRRGMFWFPIKRLIDLMGIIGYFKENKKWQEHMLKVADIVRMIDFGGGEKEISEEKLVSWRDGTTRFMEKDFYEIWQRLCPDIIVPYPFFVVATMWQIYLTDIGTDKTILCFDDRYSWWWESNLAELVNDLSLSSEEKSRWPTCFDAI